MSDVVSKQWYAVYYAVCRFCRPDGNLFQFAKNFADQVIANEITPSDRWYEIAARYSKDGLPHVVKLF